MATLHLLVSQTKIIIPKIPRLMILSILDLKFIYSTFFELFYTMQRYCNCMGTGTGNI